MLIAAAICSCTKQVIRRFDHELCSFAVGLRTEDSHSYELTCSCLAHDIVAAMLMLQLNAELTSFVDITSYGTV